MPTTATGDLSLTLYNLETLLCTSATWQSLCGVNTVDAARAFVYWPGAEPAMHATPKDPQNNPCKAVRPLAMMQLAGGWEATAESSGGGGFFHRMPLKLYIELDDTAPTSGTDIRDPAYTKERQIVFLNRIGAIIADMEVLAKTTTYLWVTAFRINQPAALSGWEEKDNAGIYQSVGIDIQIR